MDCAPRSTAARSDQVRAALACGAESSVPSGYAIASKCVRPPLASFARSESVAVLMHAGGTARVALALRVLRKDVDELLAFRPGPLIRNPPVISAAADGPATDRSGTDGPARLDRN